MAHTTKKNSSGLPGSPLCHTQQHAFMHNTLLAQPDYYPEYSPSSERSPWLLMGLASSGLPPGPHNNKANSSVCPVYLFITHKTPSNAQHTSTTTESFIVTHRALRGHPGC
jgi:hypothetical protein